MHTSPEGFHGLTYGSAVGHAGVGRLLPHLVRCVGLEELGAVGVDPLHSLGGVEFDGSFSLVVTILVGTRHFVGNFCLDRKSVV